MNIQDIIAVKRDGGVLSKKEIDFFIRGVTDGSIPDYQASALLMAMYINNLTKEEAFFMTDAMKNSGDIIDLSSIEGIKADKHSTGGVGDKTTLVVGPLAASLCVPVAKMSGRGLGFTGGTVDKLEAIPGFCTEIEPDKFISLVNENNLALAGQSGRLAPADKKIYALRDVTCTVANTGLITASVMSKKLAAGADAIVLDVKCGQGAFMESEEDAVKLAKWLVEIGKTAGRSTAAFVTEMGQPLGFAVGNVNEVIEAIEVLKGNGPEDVEELSLRLAAHMVYLAKKAKSPKEAYDMVREKLTSGEALNKMKQFVKAQGGDERVIEDYSLFPKALHSVKVEAKADGFVSKLNAGMIGKASGLCGAGRMKKDDILDLCAGVYLHKKIGDQVAKGETLATLYANDEQKFSLALEEVKSAYVIGASRVERPVLIKSIIE